MGLTGRKASIVLTVLSVMIGLLLLGHAAAQGIGAATFWWPCWSEGYESAACSSLQYEAPPPAWLAPLWVWFAEVLLAMVVIGASVAAGDVSVPPAWRLSRCWHRAS
ncbi:MULTISPECIES: hypothetical protein [unclassified Rathayibacter]|uniref:hypothetical protein n=1 Tax=unclassified Rathayibacter TaxID=2609250 RepID=UPI0006F3F98C|nr:MULTISPECIES: hypothetical protein [unclassified Rathayibacter]KQQ03402.1 hypothetical protein ASF42_07705 [Rathayibacter sp. Leaf294]KQS11857.1 hypothetical protein ASG06_07705 [Rathayibacter sp. Leaf185]